MSAERTAAPPDDASDTRDMWTARVRRLALADLPPEKLLPDHQPAYVASWIYVFGVGALAALVIVVASGVVLGFEGPQWWHETASGHFVNSLHLWSVELFMAFLVIHLWGKFWMAAWRGDRWLTWSTGALAFVAAIGTAFTGYLVQQNFDSQWISTQAKDGLNAVAIGSVFNVLNYGQMVVFHVLLLPAAVLAIVGLHLLLVRRRGVVPPIEALPPDDEIAGQPDRAAGERGGAR